MGYTYTFQPLRGDLFADPPVYPTQQQNRDSVRFLIGDTDSTDPLLDDGEVDGILNANTPDPSDPYSMPDPYLAAMQACVSLAAKFTRRASMSVGDLSIQYATVADNFRKLRLTLQAESVRRTVPSIYAGGLTASDMAIDQADGDLIQPWAALGQDDNPGTAPSYDDGTSFTQVVPG